MRIFKLTVFFLIVFSLPYASGEVITFSQTLNWQAEKSNQKNTFNDAIEQNGLPTFYKKIALGSSNYNVNVRLTNEQYQVLDNFAEESKIENAIAIQSSITCSRKQYYCNVSFVPIRKNRRTGQIEKLVSFDLVIEKDPQGEGVKKKNKTQTYTTNSVLASGNWYKVGVSKDGVYKLEYADLQSLGMDVSSISSANIRVYGNGGGMLSYNNSDFRYDDLQENAIVVEDGGDGKFNSGDYLLFYGQGPNRWKYSSSDARFHHTKNLYSDYTYYFITTDLGAGKRVQDQSSVSGATSTVTSYDDYAFHELEDTNLLSSGRQWLGESFEYTTEQTFDDFSFSNLDVSQSVYLKVDVVGASYSASTFSINAGNSAYTGYVNISAISTAEDSDVAKEATKTTTFTSTSSSIPVVLTYNKSTSSSVAWLNYIEMNVRRKLSFASSQILFRDELSVGTGKVAEYAITGANSSVFIWEVTDPINVKNQQSNLSGSTLSFSAATDSLREFVVFENSMAYSPSLIGTISNQNLHALGTDGNGNIEDIDMIIISPESFLSEAQELASFHEQKDTLKVEVVNVNEIYNEFSSGALDVCAIRDLLKMFYDRADAVSKIPSYVVLLGDGSFDPRDNRKANNNNFIPTYESADSYNPVNSRVVDDFYALLDDSEGDVDSDNGDLDMSIGRFPVVSSDEVASALNKIKHYYESASMGDWRNTICFVADDGETNGFLNDVESISSYVDANMKQFNVEKIYLDAYQQTSNAGGERYPDVNTAITNRVNKGALIINYIGHGGVNGWAHERVVEVSDINSWNNLDNMPVFMTATCEFSKFDDPEFTCAGEDVFLNQNGGGICLFTTTRAVYSSDNAALNSYFYQALYSLSSSSSSFTMGDLYLTAKNSNKTTNSKSFTLLGDPALKIAYPKNGAGTLTINNDDVSVKVDTIKALSKVTITGYVKDRNGIKASDYNGTLYPTVFDKYSTISTLGNDEESPVTSFQLQDNILFKGKASITNGDFSFSFVVPKDIGYQFGNGKISYYSENGEVDGSGYFNNFIIGGTATNIGNDTKGPDVSLYLNDKNFVFGGLTDESPLLLAYVFDSNGVNTVGNGIGHDIAAIIDGNTQDQIILNQYYQADLNSYQSGLVQYQMTDLSVGKHTLNLKVWDVYNNVSETNTEFIVESSADLALEHVLNYPNPFTTHTQFWFEHNQPDIPLDVQIQIFTIAGRLVKTINTAIETTGYRAEPIDWDGKDDYGDDIGKGVYLYRLSVSSTSSKAEKYEKLVILK